MRRSSTKRRGHGQSTSGSRQASPNSSLPSSAAPGLILTICRKQFATAEMKANGNEFRGSIPGEYTKSPFPIQYYFELQGKQTFGMYPGLGPMLTNQPYFVIRQA